MTCPGQTSQGAQEQYGQFERVGAYAAAMQAMVCN